MLRTLKLAALMHITLCAASRHDTVTVQFVGEKGKKLWSEEYSASSRVCMASSYLRRDTEGVPFGVDKHGVVAVRCKPSIFHMMVMLLDGHPLPDAISKDDFIALFRLASWFITDEKAKAYFYRRLADVKTEDTCIRSVPGPRRLPHADDTEYDISWSNVTSDDISRASKMENLVRIVMRKCRIEPDILGNRLSGLEQLKNLAELDVSETELGDGDVSTIGKMHNLKKLIMQKCRILPDIFGNSLSGLEQLMSLKHLNVHGVEDLSQDDKDTLYKLRSNGVEVWY